MKTYVLSKLSAAEIICLAKRPHIHLKNIFPAVQKILENVKSTGDAALKMYTAQFDKVHVETFQVSPQEYAMAKRKISADVCKAIRLAAKNIIKFHKPRQTREKPIETTPGVTCFRESRAIETVGVYVPGGSAPLFSTALMLTLPARLAGCKRIVLCTPPQRDGTVFPEILYASTIETGSGNIPLEIYRVGGAQAIAAMAYGTESIPKVDKIFGPGNQYVMAAKMLVSVDENGTAVDMPSGPSEILVIANEFANPAFIAADLLSQAEHGEDSQVVFITTGKNLLPQVKQEITRQLEVLPRSAIAKKSLQNSLFLLASSLSEAFSFSNMYAPEHLIVHCKNPRKYLSLIQNAGSVFLGAYSPESVGDYASGTNHSLPTSGYARSYSGISVDSFLKKITFQELTKKGLQNISKTVTTMAEAENLEAHANAVNIRL